jgi:anti-anti-sigma factor
LNHLGFGVGDLRTEGKSVDETGGLHEPPVAGVRTVDGAVVVSLVGELDLYNAHVVRERLAATTNDGGERLVVDLSGVTFIDSTGLGVLVEARSRLANRRAFVVVAPGVEARRALEISGLDRHFAVRETLEAALAADL